MNNGRYKNSKTYLIALGIVLLITGVIASWGIIDKLPVIGDPNSAPNQHVSDYYIENGSQITDAQNLVTAVLADFRGFDTLLETSVMFLAGVSVSMILSNKLKRHWDGSIFIRSGKFLGLSIKVVMPLVVPVITLYGIYVLFHGEVSIGGGFQAGALLAMAFIIYTMFTDLSKKKHRITQHFTIIISSLGVLIYAFTGFWPLFYGGYFLEYEKLPFDAPHLPELHSLGMLLIETGVTVAVMGTIINILEAVLERNSLNGSNQ